ncbi:peptidase S9 [Wenjunlia vitaminophila]|uniref:Peptidase S9 n=1 Tax=Wenjunlia vitaminophila TaxID=76728 RepID=A0A0T6LLR1_WENVI|nr:S9 family peptidase [Wenjunlia vitaminophila]KRV47059.1 peptidase S9 [Wenjunlia vitaminophila]
MTSETSYPRQLARTQRFTLGAPRSFTVAPDGSRVVFLRSRSGTDRANLLWVLDLDAAGTDGAPEHGAGGPGRAEPSGTEPSASERVVADAEALLGGTAETLSAQERARRERSREGSAGIVGYATDGAVERAAFTLSGRLFCVELRSGTPRELPVPGPVIDPRPSPDGRHVAYVANGALRVVGADGSGDVALAEPAGAGRTWGLAEFIAAEEMDRNRGFWWSPESDRLLAAHVDDSPVRRWWISDPANPDAAPTQIPYPAAGTPNAEVTLALVGLDGSHTAVSWDRKRYPYLARVHWSAGSPPILLVQARDQHSQLVLSVDTETGRTLPLHAEQDPVWLELFPGVPAWTPDGRLVRVADEAGARVLAVGDKVLTTRSLHVRAVLDIGAQDVLFAASQGEGVAGAQDTEDAPDADARGAAAGPGGPAGDEGALGHCRVAVYRGWYRGPRAWTVEAVSDPDAGLASAARGGDVTVLTTAGLDRPGSRTQVVRLDEGRRVVASIASHAATPVLVARPVLRRAGTLGIPAAVLLPTGYREGDGPLPVLMDPYGGPHGARVVPTHNAHLTSQWFADQGFAVVVADGRGTPGRSPGWEKAVAGDLAGVTLDDQVAALHALAEEFPLDLDRVGIRGWSYGGYLAALAVLRRPDVFHAAVAGAPVTDWRLYDTHYTERYLGLPDQAAAVYEATSLVGDAGLLGAAQVARPLMIVHGFADDNVVMAHALRLSSALLAAGRPHEVLPLTGVTHMASQEEVAENLLLLQVDFLRRSLGISRLPAPDVPGAGEGS